MSSSLLTNHSSTPLRTRTSSLLPVPTRSNTSSLNSSLRATPSSQPTTPSPTPTKTRTKPQSPSTNVRIPTRLPSRQASFSSNQSPIKPNSITSSSSSSSTPLPSPSSKLALAPSTPTHNRSVQKLQDQHPDHFRNLSKSFNHTLRRIPRISTVSITVDRAYPLSNSIRPEHSSSSSRRTTTSNALPPSLSVRQPPPLQPSPIVFQQTRKAKSFQELKKISSLAALNPIKPQSTHPTKPPNASPESLQSKSTLTDDGSSVRTKLDYAHHPSISSISSPISETSTSAFDNRPANIHIPPQALSSALVSSDQPEPQEFQSRAYALERLQSLIGLDEFQSLIDPDALSRLISQPGLYETQFEIQERAFQVYAPQNTSHSDPQKPHSLAHTPLGFDLSTSRVTAAVPHATLEAVPAPNTLSSIDPLTFESSSPTSNAEPQPAGNSTGPKKSNHVGNILLEKLGWKSKSSHHQNNKHGPSKSISKSLRPSSFILVSGSQKGKLSGQYATSGKTSTSDQHRFSQILGARLENMNCSTCVVLMGERLQVLPILPFTVIEEIYRRGMRVPGILRISGDLDRIDELVKKFEFCPRNGVDVSSEDIHTLCGLLKHYLRTLPEPLFHPLLSQMFWKLCVEPSQTRQADPTEDEHSLQLHVARYLLQLLPSRALSLLTYVIRFLAQIPIFAENRIQHESLAVMLGPAIFVPREIGLPGLGLHPRGPNKQPSSTTAPSVPWPSPSYTASFIEEVDKNALSQRAADSTLWLMNYSKSIFGAATEADRRRTEAPAELHPDTAPVESTPSLLQDDQQGLPLPNFPTQLTDATLQQLTQSPPQSPGTSILTYSSGLTISQPSTIHEESPQLSRSSSFQSQQLPLDEMNELSDFGYQSTQPKAPNVDSDQTLQPGFKLAFPGRLEDQPESKSIDPLGDHQPIVANPLGRSIGTVIDAYSKQTTEEVEKRDRRNSEKVIGLLTHYIEGREEKIVKQECLIESLVEEIGRLHTAEEKDGLMRERLLKQTIVEFPARKRVGEDVKSRGSELEPEPFQLQSSLTYQSSHHVPDQHNKYTDYHEQMFNFLHPSPTENTSGVPEGCPTGAADFKTMVPETQPRPSDTTLVDLPSLDRPAQAHRLSKNRLFDVTEEHGEENSVETLDLDRPPSVQNSPDSSKRIRRASHSIGNPRSSRLLSDTSLTSPDDDLISFDDHHPDPVLLQSEISRLKSLNFNLIRKLKSIESILADVSFT